LVFLAAGAYAAVELGKLQDGAAARERQTALQAVSDPRQIDEALKQHPQNRLLQLIAMATKAADDTDAALDTLSNDLGPSRLVRQLNLGTASRDDLEALRRDLKAADTTATAALPRYTELLKAERDSVEAYARAHVDKDTAGRLLDSIDRRHAEITAVVTQMLAARGEFYRAYDNYVAVLVREYGTYRIDNGQFVFPFQHIVNRYNAAAQAMTAAAARMTDLDRERQNLRTSQPERWTQLVGGK
jgi:hypothetical protein